MTALFATTVMNAKPRHNDYKLSDGGGLYLLVRPNGAKLWRLNYRYLEKCRTLAFGAWPAVGLADARSRRDEARRLLAAGIDPSHQQKVDAARARVDENHTFELVAEEWIAKNEREGMAAITLSKIRWLLDKAYPKIGNRPVAKITAQEVLAVLRTVEATGRYESARRMRSVLSRVFRYAIATTRAERDPASDLRGALTVPKPKHLAAITTTRGAGELMRAIEGYTGHVITLFGLRLSGRSPAQHSVSMDSSARPKESSRARPDGPGRPTRPTSCSMSQVSGRSFSGKIYASWFPSSAARLLKDSGRPPVEVCHALVRQPLLAVGRDVWLNG